MPLDRGDPPGKHRRVPYVEALSPEETEKLRDFFLSLRDLNRNMALATSFLGRTTVRMVSVVLVDGKLYFQTHATSTKARQIRWNPRLAFSSGPLSIEGRALHLGHPKDPGNAKISAAYRDAHPGSFENFSHRPEQRLYEVSPVRFVYWSRSGAVPYNDTWEPARNRALRDYYLGDIDTPGTGDNRGA